MKYLLMIGHAPELDGCDGWSEEMQRRGVLVSGVGLQPPEDATTVRVRGGEVLLTDGPFAETKDQVGGFNLIECADLDEAIEIAAAHPAAAYGMVEIRPVR
ncbi:YciI family protein [Nonomuraea sp. NPDC050556]|uniref:YciI family protein n=1 Tax=Nonomuraea sp. NPDC050556 TaxID=3364369 RepID=UPI0037BC57C7